MSLCARNLHSRCFFNFHRQPLLAITTFEDRPCVNINRHRSTECLIGGTNLEYAESKRNVKPFKDIPGPKGPPYFGALLSYRYGRFSNIERYQDTLLKLNEEYGNVVKQTIAGDTTVHIFHPEDVKTIYQHEGKIPYIPPLLETTQMYRQKREMSPGLGNTNGEEWYRLRSAVQQMMMRPKEVTVFLPHVNQIADEFLAKISNMRDSEGEVSTLYKETCKWSMESAAMTCFETRIGYLDDSASEEAEEMINANHNIFSLSTKLKFSLPFYKFFSTPSWKTIMASEDFFFNTGQKLVDETAGKIQALMDRGELTDDRYMFLGYLMSRKELSFKDVSIITLSLFFDGLGTTVPTLMFILYCLATNPLHQQRVFEEFSRVVPPEGEITADMINQLPFLKACVKEAFRFYPVGTDVSRIPQKDLVLGGFHIPAGTKVIMNNIVMLKKKEYFTDPETFMPERWLRGGSADYVHPFILMPFGHGPRMCAGRRFAEQEMYVLLVKILQRFRVEWHHGKMDQKFQMLFVPDCPVRFSLKDRTQSP